MPRKKRHKFKFDEDSANKLLQECYDDSRNNKSKITRLFTKWEGFAQEGGDIAGIGDQIAKLIQHEAKNLDQKIMLLKHLKEFIFEKTSQEGESTSEVGDDERNALIDMVRNQIEQNSK